MSRGMTHHSSVSTIDFFGAIIYLIVKSQMFVARGYSSVNLGVLALKRRKMVKNEEEFGIEFQPFSVEDLK